MTRAENILQIVEEVAKGWKGTAKAMKKHPEIDNPYALTNWMAKQPGYQSHKTKSGKDKKE
jgi:hypothetical protein